MKIVCISGKAQHGKDTTANMLKEIYERQGKRVLISHYGDLLKYICTKFFDWDGEKDEYGRTLLQHVGTDTIRKQSPDYWVKFIIDVLSFFPDRWDYVLIPDCRFPNECEASKTAGFDTVLLRVFRPDFDNGLTEAQNEHISETALDDYKFDITLINDGDLEDFRAKVFCASLDIEDIV